VRSSHSSELLLLGGRIYPAAHAAPVEAMLLRDGRVAALGTEAEVRALAGRHAAVLPLDGGVAVPGFTDSHVHLTAWALARRQVELAGADSVDEVVRRVAARLPAGGWVRGQGWNRHRLGTAPTREPLDRVAPGTPVFLESQDIHSAWLNGEALRRCGIDRQTPDPPGGEIARDPATGEPTGLLLEEARVMALRHLPEPAPGEVLEALRDAQAAAHRLGITAVHSVETSGLSDFGRLRERGELRLRVLQHVQLHQLDGAIAAGVRSGLGGDWLTVGGVKMFLDGALGSCTAWLREPYRERGGHGIQTLPDADFRDAAARAAAAGISSTVHAIGDAAVELALRVLGDEVPRPPALPHRIEHLQLCPPDLWERAGRSGVVLSMQPVHLLTDIPAAERHWGHERCRGAYAFARLLRAGATLAFGSDVPVETLDPRPGLFAALRRETWTGAWEGGEWFPEHALSAAEALAAYTEGPAAAAGWEARRGRLLPGFDADVTVWDRDPLRCDAAELREMRCTLTLVGGEVVHGGSAG
jgi:predicted amidohydrolase YtcJ